MNLIALVMSSLPIDSIANIASFLPLREQVQTFPEFNNCLKKVKDKEKIIRRVVYNWRLDYLSGGLHRARKVDLKRFVPLIVRKQLIEQIKDNERHVLYEMVIRGASFNEIVDRLHGTQCRIMVSQCKVARVKRRKELVRSRYSK